MKTIILLSLFFSGNYALGFPDNIRHGYTNCTTCHVSPSGGGLLSAYGRSLSRELMSTWGAKDEEHLLHGLGKMSEESMEKYFFGGDIRYLSLSETKGKERENEGFLMQAQARVGVAFEKLKFIFNIGKIANPRESAKIEPVSTEYYLLWSPKEEIYLRAGRFEPIYGIKMPDHDLWIKKEIGFVPWQERDSLEFIYEGESQFASFSGFQSTSATPTPDQQTGYVGTFSHVIGEKSRLGFSGMNSEGQGLRLRTTSLFGIATLSEKAYLLSEVTRISTATANSDLGFVRLGYEIFKGFTPFLQVQSKSIKTPTPSNQTKTGFGVIWLPRPHIELMGQYEHKKTTSDSNSDEAFLLVHYYF